MDGGQQQKQHVVIHRAILNGVAHCLADRRLRDCNDPRRNTLHVVGGNRRLPRVTRRSLEFLSDFVDNGSGPHHQVTELQLGTIQLSHAPIDTGGLDVLRGLFAASDTSSALKKVRLFDCDFGTVEEALHLISAFESNRTVLDLTVSGIRNLEGEGNAALGNCLCTLLQYNTVLQRLKYRGSLLPPGLLALQPGLRTNQTLKELSLPFCGMGNEGIRLLVVGLVGNTTLKVLDIRNNRITSTALVDITRMIASTQLEKVDAGGNRGILKDDHHAQLFAAGLHPHLKELILTSCVIGDGGIRPLVDGLVGNTTLEVLDIRNNGITTDGLADIGRLIDSTRLQKIGFVSSDCNVFENENSTQELIATLSSNSTVYELIGVTIRDLPENMTVATYTILNAILVRNLIAANAGLLMVQPLPSTTATMTTATQQRRRKQRNRSSKRKSCSAASGDGTDVSSPTRQAVVETKTTTETAATISPSAPAASAGRTLFQETVQCIETAFENINALLEQGDHEQAGLLITQYQDAGLNLRQSLAKRRHQTGETT